MKRVWITILTICLLIAVFSIGEMELVTSAAGTDALTAALPADTELVILYTGDVHGAIDAYPILAGYKAYLIAQGYEVILADAGDAVQGEYAVNRDEGATAIELMNAVGYDVAVPGNHEFDFGVERFLTIVGEAEFDYVSSNFEDLRTCSPVLSPYVLRELGGKKIAFVGITTPEVSTSVSGDTFKDENGNYVYTFATTYDYQDFITPIQKAVDAAKGEGAELVVALGHVGIEEVKEGWRASDVIAQTSGIDLFIDAHSHSVIKSATYQSKDGKDVLLTASGSKLGYIGQIVVKTDGSVESSLIDPETIDVNALSRTAKASYDAVQEKVDTVNEEVGYLFDPIGTSEVELLAKDADGQWLVRSQETALANLVADAYLYGAPDADFAIVNAGGIRSDIRVGGVSRMDMININPWSNEMVTVRITGQMLLDALEFGASKLPESNAGLLHTSSTLTYTVNTWIDSPIILGSMGEFDGVEPDIPRRVSDVKLNGASIDPEATYTVVGSKFILVEGGDGYSMFADATDVTPLSSCDSELLLRYFEEGLELTILSSAYGQVAGRLQVISEEPKLPEEPQEPALPPQTADTEDRDDFNALLIVLPVSGVLLAAAIVSGVVVKKRREGASSPRK